MKQNLWRKPGDDIGDPSGEDELPSITTDRIRWIDTDVMLADPLTKAMDGEKLVKVMNTGRWSTLQPIDSIAKKKAKQLARKRKLTEEPKDEWKPDEIIPPEHRMYDYDEPWQKGNAMDMFMNDDRTTKEEKVRRFAEALQNGGYVLDEEDWDNPIPFNVMKEWRKQGFAGMTHADEKWHKAAAMEWKKLHDKGLIDCKMLPAMSEEYRSEKDAMMS